MYTLELTDNYILIFNHKTNILSKEEIPCNIIINNKIYDFLKLNNIMYDIINKYKILNSLFKVKINILLFEKSSQSEIYLIKNLFKNISNLTVEIIHPCTYFDNNHLLTSGGKLYYQDKKVDKLLNKDYILVGYNEDYQKLKSQILKKNNCKILEYENSYRTIFDKVLCLLLIMFIL